MLFLLFFVFVILQIQNFCYKFLTRPVGQSLPLIFSFQNKFKASIRMKDNHSNFTNVKFMTSKQRWYFVEPWSHQHPKYKYERASENSTLLNFEATKHPNYKHEGTNQETKVMEKKELNSTPVQKYSIGSSYEIPIIMISNYFIGRTNCNLKKTTEGFTKYNKE